MLVRATDAVLLIPSVTTPKVVTHGHFTPTTAARRLPHRLPDAVILQHILLLHHTFYTDVALPTRLFPDCGLTFPSAWRYIYTRVVRSFGRVYSPQRPRPGGSTRFRSAGLHCLLPTHFDCGLTYLAIPAFLATCWWRLVGFLSLLGDVVHCFRC